MRATGVFFTLPPVFFSAFQGLIPDGQSLLFHDHLPAIDAFRLRAGRPNSATSREHRLPAGESPGASRVSDITTDWDKPVQTLRRSLRTAIPRGRENAAGPSLPDAKLSPGEKALPARPGPLTCGSWPFRRPSPSRHLHPLSSACKNRHAPRKTGTARPRRKAAAPAEGIPLPSALHISFSFLSHEPCPFASTQKTTSRLRTTSA